jgi:hypothetical protein
VNRRAWLHAGLTVAWVLLAIPTFLFWSDAVWWLQTMSLYAIVVGHWSAVEAAREESGRAREDE